VDALRTCRASIPSSMNLANAACVGTGLKPSDS
jgi:hypothetical protein